MSSKHWLSAALTYAVEDRMTIDGRLFVASSSDGHGFAEAPPFRDDLRGHHYPPSRAPIHSGVALANNVNGRPAAPARVLQ
eukprot:CAMPEP_0182556820 /NCGR_PEP_ID=MMETSP1324-20130603/960_1 /TAXON_ID=236786 /ORGANISM="Florenciella sp., Strain RCC1587" /LENGTH=80 /DNA_ID=CAMNT_0024768771 /DNA_START=915 /DNA_END=1158 /DNA_ORIENTATION=+